MKEIRSNIAQTSIPRTGTLTTTSVVDLAELQKEHGDSIPVTAIEKAGVFEVALEKSGKSKVLFSSPDESAAVAFVLGFEACADVRKLANKPKRKRSSNGSSES